MKITLLLPPYFKKIGFTILLISMGFLFCFTYFEMGDVLSLEVLVPVLYGKNFMEPSVFCSLTEENIAFTLILLCTIISSYFILFAREEKEDEFTNEIRLYSILWAILINHLVLFVIVLTIYGLPFISVSPYSLITLPLIYTIIFHYKLYKNSFFSKSNEQ